MDTTQLLKGVLESAVLAVLEGESTYGYDLVRKLREAGLEEVGDASVYGTLRRLYGAGMLTSEIVPSDEGPARKYYGINRSGREQLDTSRKTWAEFTTVMDRLLETDEEAIS
ncbi:MAG: PadR family transcriptional regulator [Acidimicrobiia bacterium]